MGEQGAFPPAAAAVTGRVGGQCWRTPALSGAGWGAVSPEPLTGVTRVHARATTHSSVWRECRMTATAGISNSDNKP